jgi:hypothetical protein
LRVEKGRRRESDHSPPYYYQGFIICPVGLLFYYAIFRYVCLSYVLSEVFGSQGGNYYMNIIVFWVVTSYIFTSVSEEVASFCLASKYELRWKKLFIYFVKLFYLFYFIYCHFTFFTFHEPTFYLVILFLATSPAHRESRRTAAGPSTELCCVCCRALSGLLTRL